MATNNPAECCVCLDAFDEESKCPRTLPCSHNLCSDCINNLITQKSKICPICQKDFVAESADNVMINQGLLECARYISLQRTKSSNLLQKKGATYQKLIMEFKGETSEANNEALKNIQVLKKQAEKLINHVQELKSCLSQESAALEEKILPQILSTIERINQNSELLEPTIHKLQVQVNEMENKEELLVSAKRRLDSADSLEDAAVIVDESERTNIAVSEWSEHMKKALAEEDGQLQSTRKEVLVSKRMKKDLSVALSSKAEDEEANPILNIEGAASTNTFSRDITTKGLFEMRRTVKQLIKQQRLFAVKEEEGSRKSAKITVENNELHLYSLKDEPKPVPNMYYLQYEDVLRLALSPSTMFLDLCAQELPLGRIHIRLNEHAKRLRLPSYCTGGSTEKGPGYVDTPLQVVDKGTLLERVVCGVPKAEAVSGNMYGYSLKRSSELWSGTYGSVKYVGPHGAHQVSRLAFSTGPYRDWNVGVPSEVIGEITDGLSMVSKAIGEFDDIRDITIKNCGMVLSTKRPIDEAPL